MASTMEMLWAHVQRFIIRRLRSQVSLDLPPQTEVQRELEQSSLEKYHYEQTRDKKRDDVQAIIAKFKKSSHYNGKDENMQAQLMRDVHLLRVACNSIQLCMEVGSGKFGARKRRHRKKKGKGKEDDEDDGAPGETRVWTELDCYRIMHEEARNKVEEANRALNFDERVSHPTCTFFEQVRLEHN